MGTAGAGALRAGSAAAPRFGTPAPPGRSGPSPVPPSRADEVPGDTSRSTVTSLGSKSAPRVTSVRSAAPGLRDISEARGCTSGSGVRGASGEAAVGGCRETTGPSRGRSTLRVAGAADGPASILTVGRSCVGAARAHSGPVSIHPVDDCHETAGPSGVRPSRRASGVSVSSEPARTVDGCRETAALFRAGLKPRASGASASSESIPTVNGRRETAGLSRAGRVLRASGVSASSESILTVDGCRETAGPSRARPSRVSDVPVSGRAPTPGRPSSRRTAVTASRAWRPPHASWTPLASRAEAASARACAADTSTAVSIGADREAGSVVGWARAGAMPAASSSRCSRAPRPDRTRSESESAWPTALHDSWPGGPRASSTSPSHASCPARASVDRASGA